MSALLILDLREQVVEAAIAYVDAVRSGISGQTWATYRALERMTDALNEALAEVDR